MILSFLIRQNLIPENAEGLDIVSWALDRALLLDFERESSRMQNIIHFQMRNVELTLFSGAGAPFFIECGSCRVS